MRTPSVNVSPVLNSVNSEFSSSGRSGRRQARLPNFWMNSWAHSSLLGGQVTMRSKRDSTVARAISSDAVHSWLAISWVMVSAVELLRKP